jgi:DNA-binding MarR family transcriptional regulator
MSEKTSAAKNAEIIKAVLNAERVIASAMRRKVLRGTQLTLAEFGIILKLSEPTDNGYQLMCELDELVPQMSRRTRVLKAMQSKGLILIRRTDRVVNGKEVRLLPVGQKLFEEVNARYQAFCTSLTYCATWRELTGALTTF